MQLGVIFPQTVIGSDLALICDYAQAADSLGFRHLLAYLAGITRQLELVTGVLILVQRQTALVAKQAATLDVLSGSALG